MGTVEGFWVPVWAHLRDLVPELYTLFLGLSFFNHKIKGLDKTKPKTASNLIPNIHHLFFMG